MGINNFPRNICYSPAVRLPLRAVESAITRVLRRLMGRPQVVRQACQNRSRTRDGIDGARRRWRGSGVSIIRTILLAPESHLRIYPFVRLPIELHLGKDTLAKISNHHPPPHSRYRKLSAESGVESCMPLLYLLLREYHT